MKNLLEKCDDPYLTLLAYRSTPLEVGYSPSELLMCMKLRTTVPAIPKLRQPEVSDFESVVTKYDRAKERKKDNFDARRGARELPELSPGDSVWVMDRETPGCIIEQAVERSHVVRTPDGGIDAIYYECQTRSSRNKLILLHLQLKRKIRVK